MTPERQERLRKICNKPIVYTDPNKINQKLIFLLEEFTSLMEFKREMYKLPELQFYKEWVEKYVIQVLCKFIASSSLFPYTLKVR